MKKIFLLADIGASFIKIASVDSETWDYLSAKQVAFPGFLPLGQGFQEVSVEDVREVFVGLLEEVLTEGFECLGIFMSSQMQGFVLCDSQGQALSNYISWQDSRSNLARERLSDSEIRRTGNELRPGFAANNLLWLKENNLLPAGAYPVIIADFLISNLTKCQPKIHKTNAASFGLFSLDTMAWDTEIINKLGLETLNFPEVVEADKAIAELDWQGRKIPCYVATGDHQTALLGVELKEKQLSINIGTGSQVSMLVPNLEHGAYQSRPFFGDSFLRTITHIPAGRALNNLISLVSELSPNLSEEEIWSYVNNKVVELEDTDLELDLSFFPSVVGERGSIKNISMDNFNLAHLFRASYEFMARTYKEMALRLSSSEDYSEIVLTGGIVQKNPFLVDILRKTFPDKKITLVKNTTETLVGLRLLAKKLA